MNITKDELYNLLLNTGVESDSKSDEIPTKGMSKEEFYKLDNNPSYDFINGKFIKKRKRSDSLLSPEEIEEVRGHIKDQEEELASGEYQRSTRTTKDGQVVKGIELTGVK